MLELRPRLSPEDTHRWPEVERACFRSLLRGTRRRQATKRPISWAVVSHCRVKQEAR
jgi:hypothetical protein